MEPREDGAGKAQGNAPPDFDKALQFVLNWEGRSYEDADGADSVTASEYAAFRLQHAIPVQDVRALTEDEARWLYRTHYWETMHCDAFHFPVALTLFDSAVSVGVGRVTVWIERILGFEPDGGFGPMTLSAAKAFDAVNGDRALAKAILARRRTYYENVGAPGRPLHKFLNGWLERIADLERVAGLAEEA